MSDKAFFSCFQEGIVSSKNSAPNLPQKFFKVIRIYSRKKKKALLIGLSVLINSDKFGIERR